jgi:hypothetical protein
MNKTVSFVSLFRNVKEGKVSWGASLKIGEHDVGATHLPKFDLSLFEKKTSKDGKTTYLGSKMPLVVEYSDIRPGKVAGKFFTNIVSIAKQDEADANDLDALLSGETKSVEASKDEPEPAEEQDAEF